MPADPLDRLERLNRLRESGGLTEDEFQYEKAKVLSATQVQKRLSASVWVYAAVALVMIGAVLAGVWATRSHQTSNLPVRPMQGIAAISDSAQPIAATPIPRSMTDRVADAFEAATGHRVAFTKTDAGDEVTTQPIRIVRLPFATALLTKTEIKDGCHACTGFIGVYYLDEQAESTTVKQRWPKAVQGWGRGAAPVEWYLTNKFTAYPAIYASGGFMGQGVLEESSTITELRPDGPITSDVIGTGFSDDGAIVDNERPACVVKGSISNLRKDRSFDVVVRGSVNAVDHYTKKNGRFVAVTKRDWGLPCDSVDSDLASVRQSH